MRWFQGGIAEAVAASKAQNAVFVVFVEGNDDESKMTASSIDSSDVSTKLENGEFVAIKLDSGSESYRQFAQIYQLVPVPSVFFIGGNGVPLEVVAGGTGTSELVARIDSILEKRGKASSSPVAAQLSATPTVSDATAPSTSAQSPNVEAAPSTSAPATAAPTVAAATDADSLAKDDKLERAKQLLELKRQQKQEEEEEAARNRELERRRVGQDVQRMRRSQQDQEMKELREQRQREKTEEATARQRVLLQIAQDKAERAARLSQEKSSEPQKQQQQQTTEPSRSAVSDTTRIQFRLPDGMAHTHQFSSTAQLSEVRAYAATTLNLPFSDFAMSTTFPRRDFTASDHCLTVTDLQLVPTAVILILPAASTAVVSSPGYLSSASRLFWSLLAPVLSIFTYLRGLVFRGGNEGSTSGSSSSGGSVISRPAPKRVPPVPTEEAQSVRRRQPPPDSTLVRRQGNVHRLTNRPDSSDDENNTWNGNSTQQM